MIREKIKSFKNSGGGFTFIEAIVVISISIVLTTILVSYTRTSEKQIIFFKDHSVLVNALFRAKSFAIETFQPRLTPGLAPSGEIVCGWGVHFERFNAGNRFVLFRDIAPSNGACNPSSVGNYQPNQNETFEVFELDPNVIQISCIRFGPAGSCTSGVSPASMNAGVKTIFAATGAISPGGGGPGNLSQLDIFFLPPDPQTIFTPPMSSPADYEAIIVLRLADGSRESSIRVNRAGQISYD